VPWDNASNPGRGRDFQTLAATLLGKPFGVQFRSDYPLPIGDPAKLHRFDLVAMADDESPLYVGECKNYTWTETGNVPSAKMAFMNEALLYLSHAPTKSRRFVAVPGSVHARRSESLAEYYCRTYSHLLRGIAILEIFVETGEVKSYWHGKRIEGKTPWPA